MAEALFPFSEFEPRWQAEWEKAHAFRAKDPGEGGNSSKKFYILDMFPYPSGAGLHVGHPEGYTATDILSRYLRMKGWNVLHPMGWDAFGLPAEQYAIQTGTHPEVTTRKNIDNFRRQIKRLGFSYDWEREVDTTDPDYFKWTQWIFLKLFEKGLAYEAHVPVWWCEELGCVLANEEVIDGKSERGGYPVVRRPLRQWMLKITAYADRLLEDLEGLDWSASIKEMQKNWIGKSIGAEVDFALSEGPLEGERLKVFTTRPDTLYGATFMVLAPEHPWVDKLVTPAQRPEVNKIRSEILSRSELDRTGLNKDKIGVFTGSFAVNPVNGARIPVWIADYVLMTYGTGAIMAVPAHDERDYDFARKYRIPVVEVISGGDIARAAYTGEGKLVNSGSMTGLASAEAIRHITQWLESKGLGKKAVNYKLRDWLFSRQRYWGEPIPIVHCPNCGVVAIPEKELPLKLPEMKDFKPTGDAEPPLARAEEWVQTKCPRCGKGARRETNTMPQWAGSCWYYLRYLDPKNTRAFLSPDKEKYWMNVDLYVGGAEHAVLHLLYARFWHKVLFDLGLVSTREPFQKLVNQGIILGEDGQKMSKSRGNVINPDEVIDVCGADTLRLYEMFMGPLEQSKSWSSKGVEGVYRFLGRVWRTVVDETGRLRPDIKPVEPGADEQRYLHELIKKVTADLDRMAFNTAISAFMIFLNETAKFETKSRSSIETFLILLAPFAPHMAEELWHRLGNRSLVALQAWPQHDERWLKTDSVEMVIQVNGRVRAKLQVPHAWNEDQIKTAVLKEAKVQEHLSGQTIRQWVIVPGRLVNIVARN